jgi:HEAT repeat protein
MATSREINKMRPLVLLLIISLSVFGCRGNEGPKEKYFSGKPIDYWLEAVKKPALKTRMKAADVLGNVGPIDRRAIPALIDAVKDRDARVRDAAILGLSKIGRPAASAESVLQEATKDKDATVRSHALTALERVRGEK